MMNAKEWFENEFASLKDDPDYLTEEVLLDVTEQIYVRMEEAGMRPADLARRLDVSRAFVSQLLNGKPNMTMRTLVGVAHALGQRVQVNLRPAAATRAATSDYTRRLDHLCLVHEPDPSEAPQAA